MHFQIFDYNNKHGVYNFYHYSIKKKKKMWHVSFLLKVVIVYSENKEGFDYKNNHRCS